MIDRLRIAVLLYRRWWTEVQIEIDQAALQAHEPSLKLNQERLRRIDTELACVRHPAHIIESSLRRPE